LKAKTRSSWTTRIITRRKSDDDDAQSGKPR
jgi:hypothetical protein